MMSTSNVQAPPPVPAIPKGTIIMWNFLLSSTLFDKTGLGINSMKGWAVCNGNNKTPNLKDRFVVGAGNNYALGDTGGEAEVTLTTSQMPRHGHAINNGNFGTLGIGIETEKDSVYIPYCSTGNTGQINTDYNGDNQAHNNVPPYYAMYFIMRIA